MKTENIRLGKEVEIDPTTVINNITIGNQVKIAKHCTLFGAATHPLQIGDHCYIGMGCLVEGFNAQIKLGNHVSLAQGISLLSGSGPNASPALQRVFPIVRGPITIRDHTWIGTGVTIMPGVALGKFCVVGVNSFVNQSFPDFSIVGGSPARLIRTFTAEEQKLLLG